MPAHQVTQSCDVHQNAISSVQVALKRIQGAWVLVHSAVDLRDDIAGSLLLTGLWSYVCFIASAWEFPICLVILFAAASRHARFKHPSGCPLDNPCLFREEFRDEGNNLLGVAGAAIRFERSLVWWTTKIEKVCAIVEKWFFAASLRDPAISLILSCFVVVLAILASVTMWILPSCVQLWIVWLAMLVHLLPAPARAMKSKLLQVLKKKMPKNHFMIAMKNTWACLPDAAEAGHLLLCEKYILDGAGRERQKRD
eukprot:gnl/MRDRNA2_/MRDRNA2_193183_c0_seq1.p1 gnl/MRDRNA2_/MRDRNA2_193183_c0~~gnl/MRDRNA2_/MRDRNA2_193183_c0_seq1.p1  ORF type:complete len:254 (-),score=40.38 gnl/MRDRNA2_/MRDRNA2_193183_c0_seq1:229-990(-)